jgi:hypothetical protein
MIDGASDVLLIDHGIARRSGEQKITVKIDIGKAQIDGKKLLTAKDPQGKLLFSGPVETKEDLDKIPAEVRQRYDKLQEEELRSVAPPSDTNEDGDSGRHK